ncbi:MAG: signal recognition particle-docking protein FtsY [Spirochaetales bacterium]|nr:signal recognition particle-docking protein FtsY [Spirochaetales bacterium]
MSKISLGERLKKLFGIRNIDESIFDDLEDILIEADVGAAIAVSYVDQLRTIAQKEQSFDAGKAEEIIKRLMANDVKSCNVSLRENQLNIFLVCGVNGVGKTTTIGKLAKYFSTFTDPGRILLSAADTFRAAAIDQLTIWGDRLGMRVIAQAHGSDPGAVVFDTIESAYAKNASVVIIDTSGRMHTKEHLVKELVKIDKIVNGKIKETTQYHRMIVLDATTGQNALRQAEVFQATLGLDSAILSKHDSAAKGGTVIGICREFSIPFSFLGKGEGVGDLVVFDTNEYLESLFV